MSGFLYPVRAVPGCYRPGTPSLAAGGQAVASLAASTWQLLSYSVGRTGSASSHCAASYSGLVASPRRVFHSCALVGQACQRWKSDWQEWKALSSCVLISRSLFWQTGANCGENGQGWSSKQQIRLRGGGKKRGVRSRMRLAGLLALHHVQV